MGLRRRRRCWGLPRQRQARWNVKAQAGPALLVFRTPDRLRPDRPRLIQRECIRAVLALTLVGRDAVQPCLAVLGRQHMGLPQLGQPDVFSRAALADALAGM